MLSSLCIHNFTTVEQLDLDFNAGLTCITGETGAGKSVLLDAIALTIGSRTNKESLRDESRQAEASSQFELPRSQCDESLSHWLNERDLIETDANEIELILRRVIRPDGRSKAYLNGSPIALSELRWLGEKLVDLHSQHEYQSLLKRSTQQLLLDDFAKHPALIEHVQTLAKEWKRLSSDIEQLKGSQDNEAQLALLRYQVNELDTLDPQPGEVLELEQKQKTLSAGDSLKQNLQQALLLMHRGEENSALGITQQANALVAEAHETLQSLNSCVDLLNSACIQLQEAGDEIEQLVDKIVVDPEQLLQISNRLDNLYAIARKHNANPEQLTELHTSLKQELDQLENSDQQLIVLEQKRLEVEQRYLKAAKKLSKSRTLAAKALTEKIQHKLAALSLKHCVFEIALVKHQEVISVNGQETVELLISTIPDKAPAPLAKIASGGELSRISLAIQVVTAQTSNTPTLVFDEVDVGISGGTAEVVGNLLRELGEHCQVLCVTHQAQVAAKGHQHLLVSKRISASSVHTKFELLDSKLRTAEIARMIGGIELTSSTLTHAEEMLGNGS